MKKLLRMLFFTVLLSSNLGFANCPTIDKISCNRQFGGLACGADYPGWLGYIDPASGPDSRGDTKVVYYDNRVLWVNTKQRSNEQTLGQIYCYYRGDKGSIIKMGAGNFGIIPKPIGNQWHRGDAIWEDWRHRYSTLACMGSINSCQFTYNG
jgi:hypothetical protein